MSCLHTIIKDKQTRQNFQGSVKLNSTHAGAVAS